MILKSAAMARRNGVEAIKPAAFVDDARGVAAVEFAFSLPIMLLILALVVVIGQALVIAQKVTTTTRTIVDIVSRNSQLSTSDLSAILNASAYTMAPYDSSSLSMVIAEIQTNGSGAGTVTWSSSAYNGVALTKGSSFTLPAAMATANATYIYGSVAYAYTPIGVSTLLPRPIQLTDSAYFSPRTSATVNYPYPN